MLARLALLAALSLGMNGCYLTEQSLHFLGLNTKKEDIETLLRSGDLPDGDETNQENAMPPYGRETVLLVEADKETADERAENLRGFGYTVLTASDPLEAVAFAEKEGERPVDLIVAKEAIPGLGGHEPAGTAESSRGKMRVLVVSGWSDDGGEPHSLAMKVRETLDDSIQS